VVTRVAPTFLRFGSFEIFKQSDPFTGRAGPSAGLEPDMLPKARPALCCLPTSAPAIWCLAAWVHHCIPPPSVPWRFPPRTCSPGDEVRWRAPLQRILCSACTTSHHQPIALARLQMVDFTIKTYYPDIWASHGADGDLTADQVREHCVSGSWCAGQARPGAASWCKTPPVHAACRRRSRLPPLIGMHTCLQKQTMISEWFREVCRRTGRMVALWMCVGWVHGVLNTDNMSILGLTLVRAAAAWRRRLVPWAAAPCCACAGTAWHLAGARQGGWLSITVPCPVVCRTTGRLGSWTATTQITSPTAAMMPAATTSKARKASAGGRWLTAAPGIPSPPAAVILAAAAAMPPCQHMRAACLPACT